MYEVLKPFAYSVDGFTHIDLNAGDVRDFGSISAGLLAEGFITALAERAAISEQAVTIEVSDMPADAPVEFAVETVAETKPVVRRGRK